jgi:hypothetical protein
VVVKASDGEGTGCHNVVGAQTVEAVPHQVRRHWSTGRRGGEGGWTMPSPSVSDKLPLPPPPILERSLLWLRGDTSIGPPCVCHEPRRGADRRRGRVTARSGAGALRWGLAFTISLDDIHK